MNAVFPSGATPASNLMVRFGWNSVFTGKVRASSRWLNDACSRKIWPIWMPGCLLSSIVLSHRHFRVSWPRSALGYPELLELRRTPPLLGSRSAIGSRAALPLHAVVHLHRSAELEADRSVIEQHAGIDAEPRREATNRARRRVRIAVLDVRDTRLIKAGPLGELLLGKSQTTPERVKTARQSDEHSLSRRAGRVFTQCLASILAKGFDFRHVVPFSLPTSPVTRRTVLSTLDADLRQLGSCSDQAGRSS